MGKQMDRRGVFIQLLEERRLLALTGAEIYTSSALTTGGLVGSYVDKSLQDYAPQDDWRVTQAVAGVRTDAAIDFPTSSFGSRAAVGITGGSDANWENFSVQWDGYLKVTRPNVRLATKSDDGNRMWIDLNHDGSFDNTGAEFVNNHWGASQGDTTGDRSAPLAVGTYAIRIQYYESGGGNSMTLVSSPLAPISMPQTSTNTVQTVKVLVLDYDPRVPSQANRLLHDVMHWADPRDLAAGYKSDLEWASGGAVNFQIVDWRDLDEMPVFSDGFRYNADDYVQRYRSGGPWHTGGGGGADFYAMAARQHLAEAINSGAVDEIWTFGGPFMGIAAESFMAGPNSFFVNGPTYPDLAVDRAVVGYGFNYERGVAEMIHDNGHRTENHMTRAYGGTWNGTNPVTPWEKFAADYGQAASAPYGVGSTHYPANGASDYDYASTLTVPSTALDWQNYPNLTGATTQVNRDNWGWGANASDYQRDYLDWFFSLLPRNTGTTADGRQNNWYKYIYDFNSYEPNTGLPRQEDAFASGGVISSAGGTTRQFTVRYYDVTGVNTSTLDGADVRVTGPNGFSAAATLVSVGAATPTTAGTARTVTYQIAAPGGTWDGLDAGTYTISLQSSQVRDTLGNYFPAGQIGTFRVELADTSRIDVNAAVSAGHANVSGTTIDISPLANMFDGSTSTIVRTPNINPASFQVAFDSLQTLTGFRLYFQGGQSSWTIEVADTQADLDGKTGSWRRVVPTTTTPSDQFSVVTLGAPVNAKFVKLTATRLVGDGYVHIAEWQLLGVASTDIAPPGATATLPSVTTPGGTSYFVPLTFTDATGINIPSLQNGNVRITGPNGFDVGASFYDVNDFTNGTPRTAQYYFIPPGGAWDADDDGAYTVTLLGGKVSDSVGNVSAGATTLGTITVNIPPPQRRPDADLTEGNAAQWTALADQATASAVDDPSLKLLGNASVKFTTNGGFDTSLSFPPVGGADWDLTEAKNLYFSVYAQNPSSIGFQQDSPLIRLRDSNGGYIEFAYYQNGGQYQLLNDARGQWRSYVVPLNASTTQSNGWRRTVVGAPRLDHIASLEFHADTWDFGFTLWYDRVGFDIPVHAVSPALQLDAPKPAVQFTFDQDVGSTLTASDVVLRDVDTNTTIAATDLQLAYDAASRRATLTFPGLSGGRLPDGNYRLTLAKNAVADVAGNTLSGDFSYEFFILAGDADHNRTVDFNDLVKLAQNYNTTGKTFAQGDFNYDGNVDFNDLVILAQRYNTSLPTPGADAMPASTPSSESFAATWAMAIAPVPPPTLSKPIQKKKPPVFSVVPVPKPAPAKQNALPRHK